LWIDKLTLERVCRLERSICEQSGRVSLCFGSGDGISKFWLHYTGRFGQHNRGSYDGHASSLVGHVHGVVTRMMLPRLRCRAVLQVEIE